MRFLGISIKKQWILWISRAFIVDNVEKSKKSCKNKVFNVHKPVEKIE